MPFRYKVSMVGSYLSGKSFCRRRFIRHVLPVLFAPNIAIIDDLSIMILFVLLFGVLIDQLDNPMQSLIL